MENLLKEQGDNSTIMPYNSWVKGIAAKEFSSSKVFLKDILNKKPFETQHPNDSKADNVLPYPLPHLVESLGSSVVNVENSQRMLLDAINNPLLQDNHNKALINKSLDILKNISKALKEVTNNLDYLKISIK